MISTGTELVMTSSTESSANGRLVKSAITNTSPCAINCTNDRQPYGCHPGGCNFLFADGSVHFVPSGMSIRVLAALATRAGGEVLPGENE